MSKLVCVRPDHTVEFKYQGGVFQIGIIPRTIYAQFIDAGQRQVAGKASGEDMLNIQLDVVKYGVKGHSGLEFEDGSEVPFKVSKSRLNGKNMEVVADETLDIYYASGLLTGLFQKISSHGADNEDDDSKK